MYRGTTPKFIFTLPNTTAVSDIDAAFVSFEQNGAKIIEKELADMTIDAANNTLLFQLTQAETLSLQPGQIGYQLRFKIGSDAYASKVFIEDTSRIIKDGQI